MPFGDLLEVRTVGPAVVDGDLDRVTGGVRGARPRHGPNRVADEVGGGTGIQVEGVEGNEDGGMGRDSAAERRQRRAALVEEACHSAGLSSDAGIGPVAE